MEPEFEIAITPARHVTVRGRLAGHMMECTLGREEMQELHAIEHIKQYIRRELMRLVVPPPQTYTAREIARRYGTPFFPYVRDPHEPQFFTADHLGTTSRLTFAPDTHSNWHIAYPDLAKAECYRSALDVPAGVSKEELAEWDEYDQSED